MAELEMHFHLFFDFLVNIGDCRSSESALFTTSLTERLFNNDDGDNETL